jgi:hypothetical protein
VHEAFIDEEEEASTGAANNDVRCGRYVAISTDRGDAMDPRDEKEDMIQRAVTAIAFVPADAENPSGCALRVHFHSAMPSFSSAVGVFLLPFWCPHQHESTMEAAKLFKLPETADTYRARESNTCM